MFLDNLPSDCVFEILSFLSLKDVIFISSVSKKWTVSIASRSDRFWSQIFERRIKETEIEEEKKKEILSSYSSSIFEKYKILRIEELIHQKLTPPIRIDEQGIHYIKVVVVGDHGVGKSCLVLLCGGCNTFQFDVPDVVEPCDTVMIHKDFISLNFVDTPESIKIEEDREKYKNTHVYIICFSLTDRKSLENAKKIWKPRISKYTSNIILCGTKLDLLEYERRGESSVEKEEFFIPLEIREKIAKEILSSSRRNNYYEVSSKSWKGIKELLHGIIDLALSSTTEDKKSCSGSTKCMIM